MGQTELTQLRFKLSPDQKAALNRVAADRGISTCALLRALVANVTGVGDPVKRYARHGTGRKRRGGKALT